jgi:hypothetical protein
MYPIGTTYNRKSKSERAKKKQHMYSTYPTNRNNLQQKMKIWNDKKIKKDKKKYKKCIQPIGTTYKYTTNSTYTILRRQESLITVCF